MDASNTNGIRIYTAEDQGYQRFSIKLQEKYQLEENPNAGCKNYKKRNEYAEVQKFKINYRKLNVSILILVFG